MPDIGQSTGLCRIFCKVSGIELIIFSLLGDQVIVRTALDDAALFHNHDTVGVLYRGETMGDDKGRAALHQGIHTVLDKLFGTGINGGCRFIKNQCRRIGHSGAGNGKELTLALA